MLIWRILLHKASTDVKMKAELPKLRKTIDFGRNVEISFCQKLKSILLELEIVKFLQRVKRWIYQEKKIFRLFLYNSL